MYDAVFRTFFILIMSTDIRTVKARDQLAVDREPYWHRVMKGRFVGYRKMSKDTDGTWLARYRNETTGKQDYETFGTLDSVIPSSRFDHACELARKWFEHLGAGGSTTVLTVLDACNNYAAHVAQEKNAKASADLENRYRRWVENDPIASIALSKLTREHCKGFRKRLINTPVAIGKSGATRERAKDTINRDLTAVRAALNYAKKDGYVTTDFAWAEAFKAIPAAGRRRNIYLDVSQRAALIRHAPQDLAIFLQALSVLPIRPGALAALKVLDFEPRNGTLNPLVDKANGDRKFKLPQSIVDFIAKMAKDKPPSAHLLLQESGRPWNKDAWKGPLKQAAAAAKLPHDTVATNIRHSVITDLVVDGLDLFSVASMSGTSIEMIQDHYGHLLSDVTSSALDKLAQPLIALLNNPDPEA